MRAALVIGVVLGASLAGAQTAHYGRSGPYALPDAHATPGDVRSHSRAELCAPSFRAGAYRHTGAALKRRVCALYGIRRRCPGKSYELDHLVPLELGGADVAANLWPQPIAEARVKDKLENALHRAVCKGSISLGEAQRCIAKDWRACAAMEGQP
jgi:hypothetical protein